MVEKGKAVGAEATKQLEESLEAANQRLSNILASITDAFVAFDNQWRFTYVNQEAARLLQRSPEELVGKSVWEETFPNATCLNQLAYRELHRAVEEQVTVKFESFSFPAHSWVEISAFPFPDGLAVYFRDISDRKQEEQRKAAQSAVTRVLAEATTLVDAVPAILQSLCTNLEWQVGVIWSVDRHQNVLRYVNSWQASSVNVQEFIETTQQTTFASGIGIPGRVWESRQPIWIPELTKETNLPRAALAARGELQAAFGFPIQLKDEVFGVIECFSDRVREPDEDLLQMMAEIGSQIGQFMERKRTEEELRLSEERFRLATSAVAGIVYDWDIRTGKTYRSEGLHRLIGVAPQAARQNRDWWLERIHPDDLTRLQPMMSSILASRSDRYEAEYRVRHENGRWIHVWDRGYLIRDRNGQLIRVVGFTADISDRKQAETEKQQLLEQIGTERELLETVLRQMPAGVMVADALSGKIILSNERIKQIWRIPSVSSVGHSEQRQQYRGFHPDGRPYQLHEWPLARSVSTGEVVTEEEISYLRGDGTQGFILVNSAPIWDSQGNIKAAVVTFIDISERKQAEMALRKSETILNAFLASSPIGMAFLDRELRYIYANEALATINGIPLDEHLGRTVWEVLPAWASQIQAIAQQVMETKEPLLNREVIGETNPPEVHRYCLVNYYPVCLPDGQMLGIGVTSMDITARKQVEAEREQLLEREQAAREQAEAANHIKDEFLAVLSHELRSPLNPILGWAGLLRSRKFDEKATDRALESIERNAKLQTQLIEDLLDVSRILRGKMLLDVRPVNLTTTIEGALETVRLAAQAKEIQIQTILDANVGKVAGDSNRLQQVVWNLLSNAVKFTPSRGWIEVRLEQVGSDAQIQVKDNGKGISPEFLPHVFEYFRQADGTTTRKFGGLGLGLAIVRHLVELHGGSVLAASPGEGLGATFTVRLPLLGTSPEVDREVRSDNLADLSGLRVLVVDDEADIRDLVACILERSGAEVTIAKSAAEALAALNQSVPNILLSDIGMPEVDGYMLMRQVRALPPERGGQLKAIALTAYAGESNQQQALAAGFQLHLAKPVEPEELVRAIARLMATDNPN